MAAAFPSPLAAATTASTSPSAPPPGHPLPLGSLVLVASRTTPGINKAGGVASVLAWHGDRGEYDVKYVLHAGRETGVSHAFVAAHEFAEPKSRRARDPGPSPRAAPQPAPQPVPQPVPQPAPQPRSPDSVPRRDDERSQASAPHVESSRTSDVHMRDADDDADDGAAASAAPPDENACSHAAPNLPASDASALPEARCAPAPPVVTHDVSEDAMTKFKRVLRHAFGRADALPLADVVRAAAPDFPDEAGVRRLLEQLHGEDNSPIMFSEGVVYLVS